MSGINQLDPETISEIKTQLYNPIIQKDYFLRTRVNKDADSRDRPPYQRDYTRIMYSTAFRRLQGKMQLLDLRKSKFYRNRLTHSLEVAQIARSIADDIYNGEDVYVVEACALAHDIGNPPFGHNGETILNKIMTKHSENGEGFEGNAQTMRVLTKLQSKDPDYEGMNLTYRTLLGVAKNFFPHEGNSEKKAKNNKYLYNDDYICLNSFVDRYNITKKTLDMQIMDISDRIAYAAHDLEDSLNNRVFSIDEFLMELKYNQKGFENVCTAEKRDIAIRKMDDIIYYAKLKTQKVFSDQYNSLFSKELGSKIIFELIRDIGVTQDDQGNKELGFKTLSGLADMTKEIITFECLNHTKDVKMYELMGETIIYSLFDFYQSHFDLLPLEYKRNIGKDKKMKSRAIIDFISGMMDSYAIELYGEIFGKRRLETFGIYKNFDGVIIK